MSERERWIVYPLLFLALGAALRDKLAKQTRTKQLVCEELFVVDAAGRPQAQLKGAQLKLDIAGNDRGFVVANVVQADVVRGGALLEGNRRVAADGGGGVGVSWPQLLELLQRMGLLRLNVNPAPPAEGQRVGPDRGAGAQHPHTEGESSGASA